MRVLVHSVQDVGVAVRVVRKSSGVRQDDAAGSAGVSQVFLKNLEHGKQTIQFGRVLQVLKELGIRMELEIPDDAMERWHQLVSQANSQCDASLSSG